MLRSFETRSKAMADHSVPAATPLVTASRQLKRSMHRLYMGVTIDFANRASKTEMRLDT